MQITLTDMPPASPSDERDRLMRVRYEGGNCGRFPCRSHVITKLQVFGGNSEVVRCVKKAPTWKCSDPGRNRFARKAIVGIIAQCGAVTRCTSRARRSWQR